MKILTKLEKSIEFWFLLVTSFIFFLLRLPSLFEPYWYGDEGIYQVLGMAIKSGKLLYRDAWDNKPPLLYALYGVFSSDQFTVRLVSLIFGILAIISFYYLAKELFADKEDLKRFKKIILPATFIFSIFFGIPLLEGNIANSENFMLFPIILGAYLLIKSLNSKKEFYLLSASGLLLSIAFLFKVVALFDFAAFLAFLIIADSPRNPISIFSKKNIVNLILKIYPFVLSFITPIILVALFFFFNGAIKDFISAALIQNVGYVGYGNSFLFKNGLLLIKLIFLSLFLIFLFFKKSIFDKSSLFIFIWIAFSLFNAFFSQRPYTHYILVLLPSYILLLGLVLSNKKMQKITLTLSVLIFFLVAKNFNIYWKTFFYYQNYISFITNRKSVSSYMDFFDRKVSRDYEIAQFIKTHTTEKDNIYVWGNSAQIYKLTDKLPPGRYTVAYHVTSFRNAENETYEALKKSNPKYIIIESSKDFIPFPVPMYQSKIKIDDSTIYERIF